MKKFGAIFLNKTKTSPFYRRRREKGLGDEAEMLFNISQHIGHILDDLFVFESDYRDIEILCDCFGSFRILFNFEIMYQSINLYDQLGFCA